MYSFEERGKAVELYIKYGLMPSNVIHELGYPVRTSRTMHTYLFFPFAGLFGLVILLWLWGQAGRPDKSELFSLSLSLIASCAFLIRLLILGGCKMLENAGNILFWGLFCFHDSLLAE